MKRIIDGVTYNTDTATLVASASWDADPPYEKSHGQLFQNAKGAFFLVRHDHHPRKVTSATVTPMTHSDAQEWVMTGEVELHSETFPEPPEAENEDQPSATIYIRVPATLKARIEKAAQSAGLSVNSFMLRCAESCASETGAE